MDKTQAIRKLIRETLEQNFVVDKYGDKLSVDTNWLPMKFPISEYKTLVKDSLLHIICEEEEISEKSFQLIDAAITKVRDLINVNSEIQQKIQDFESQDTRPQFAAEHIFYEYYINDSEDNILDESKKKKKKAKSKFQKLKDNKVPLTDEEREEVMKAGAIWHHGPNGEETPAVWKSKNKDGSFTFVTNTHRAYQDRSTVKAAIKIYHDFIKGTA